MTPNAPAVPSLGSLYWNDSLFGFGLKVCGFGIVVAAGFWWLGQPMPNAQPLAGNTFEATVAAKVPPIALGVAALALLLAAWRYLRVRKIFVDGEIIHGTVEELKTETSIKRQRGSEPWLEIDDEAFVLRDDPLHDPGHRADVAMEVVSLRRHLWPQKGRSGRVDGAG